MNFRVGWLPVAVLTVAACGDVRERTPDAEGEPRAPEHGDTAPAGFRDTMPAGTAGTDTGTGTAPAAPAAAAPQDGGARLADSRPTPSPRQQRRAVTATVPMGTSMSLTLDETLSTERNTVGDAFTATLRNDLVDAGGDVVVPAGATVRGRLTRVDPSGGAGETGMIRVAFEAVSFAGRSYPIEATIVRANPRRSNRSALQEQEQAATAAASTAVTGRILGSDVRSTLRSAALTGTAGTTIALGTTDVPVVLPAGSEMVIRLDSPMEVRRTGL